MKNHKKPNRTEKIIQFGEGGFLRAFVDWFVQTVNEKTDFDASVVVVQPLPDGLCSVLEEQNCNYTLLMRGRRDGKPAVERKIIDCISRTVRPYDDFAAFLSLAENRDFRLVVSNTTEAGIAFCASDTPDKAPFVTFPAKVTLLLLRRYELGLPGFIFLPCELIDKNGAALREYILKYAELWNLGDGFCRFVREENVFYNTLVDRIVTGYPRDEKIELPYEDRMLDTSELFHLWVIEGEREPLCSAFPFEKTDLNIIVTDNLEPYRTRKVRILNGAHTSMIPYALLSGVESVGECMKNDELYGFVTGCVFEEIIPTLSLPRELLVSYANDVFERFQNPYITHLCSSIALNSVSKFRVRVLPSLLAYIEQEGKMPDRLLTAFAKLILFYKEGAPNDSPEVTEFMKTRSLGEILSNEEFWGQNLAKLESELEKRMYL